MRDIIQLLESIDNPSDLEAVKVSYSESDLTPVLSSDNLKQHFKLWNGYVDRFNKKEGDLEFNYAGTILHNLFFTQFRQKRNNNVPNGPIGNFISSKFKTWDSFKDSFIEEAMKLQGSGWIYLARDGYIKTIHNHEIKSDIVLIVDMWEHAYQMDYSVDKKKYLTSIWKIMDWNVINTRYMKPYKN